LCLRTSLTESGSFSAARRNPAISGRSRALKNMGFTDLRLVAPVASALDRAATSMAVHGGDVLTASTIEATSLRLSPIIL
jgi:hypothetical protein